MKTHGKDGTSDVHLVEQSPGAFKLRSVSNDDLLEDPAAAWGHLSSPYFAVKLRHVFRGIATPKERFHWHTQALRRAHQRFETHRALRCACCRCDHASFTKRSDRLGVRLMAPLPRFFCWLPACCFSSVIVFAKFNSDFFLQEKQPWTYAYSRDRR
jgi:hypothetical protein